MAPLTRDIIDTEHYVARYAKGRLSGSELEAFEEYCLLHPELVPEVATDRALIRGAKALRASGELSAPLSPSRMPRRPALRYFALAASIAVFAVVAWLRLDKGTRDPSYSLYASAADIPAAHLRQPLGEAFRLVRTRSPDIPLITIASDVSVVQLELTPSDTAGADEYQVSLQSESNGRLTRRAMLPRVRADAADPDVVEVFLEVAPVDTAHLYVTLSAAGKRADVYELRVVRRR